MFKAGLEEELNPSLQASPIYGTVFQSTKDEATRVLGVFCNLSELRLVISFFTNILLASYES